MAAERSEIGANVAFLPDHEEGESEIGGGTHGKRPIRGRPPGAAYEEQEHEHKSKAPEEKRARLVKSHCAGVARRDLDALP